MQTGEKGTHLKRLLIYNTAMALAWPALLLYYFLQVKLSGKYRENYLYRMGLKLPPPLDPGKRVWVHALSLGEVLSVVPLLEALKDRCSHLEIVATTATASGQKAAGKLQKLIGRLSYLPHDFPWAVRAVIRRWKPSLFVQVETDVWPNMLRELGKENVPRFLVNARLSPVSAMRLERICGWFSPYEDFDLIFPQSEQDRKRFLRLGVNPDRIVLMGNLKYDAAPAKLDQREVAELKAELQLDPDRPVFIGGSTHWPEEKILMTVCQRLKERHPGLLLILAPRNLQKLPVLTSFCKNNGFAFGLRSRNHPARGRDIYFLDTFGELRRFYALADIAFIGGSLVPFGGHNPIEAAAQGKPVLFGPHLFNFREVEADLMEAGCGRRVLSEDELEKVIDGWLSDRNLLEKAKHLAAGFMESHAGCSCKLADLIERTLQC